ncbi:MAG TPA: Ppx/GppA family phosphatase [Azospirillum sp.]|nr:Ppx/GppA family phosphatase [Azospirillum sp.]
MAAEERRGASRPETIAVIDIGSNSIRLVVYDGLKRSPMPIFNEKVLCGLGRGVEKSRRLNPDGVRAALAHLPRFRQIAEGMRVPRVDVLATAAVRDAKDGPAFVKAVEQATGLSVRIVSGEEEAQLAANGVLSGTPEADGLVGDLGGGSLELVTVSGHALGRQVTLPLGPLRLMEAGESRGALVKAIDQHLDSLPWLGEARGRTFYPVGGSWRALAKLHMEQIRHPLHIIHHYTVPAGDLRQFADLIARQSTSTLAKLAGSRRRGDTLPYAALVLERLIKAAGPRDVVFSAYGLREGHLFSLLPPDVRQEDPLLAACADWGLRFCRFGDPSLLVPWTAGLFAGEDALGQRLRHAACLLSDVGWAEHPDYRADHAFLRVLRYPFPGCDHAERVFLALACYARYAGTIDAPVTAGVRGLLSDAQQKRALVLGLGLRLALNLTGGASAFLQRTALKLGGESLVLTLPDDAQALDGETVRRRLDALAKALNRRAEVVATPPRPLAAE